ncbi:Na+/H+ antiporter NhaA [Luedemannella flava]|uniref:Na(+)/H(+) antiporter NhaA n=1 Tax=Luedemannella flava TaxID=349316 RepID=A0ABN2LFD6_9ACTN
MSQPGPVRRAVTPLAEFLRTEAGAATLLLMAALTALFWANSPAGDSYAAFWHHELTIGRITEDLQHWVNDGLMAIFFFVVGLEIKRELVVGELREARAALMPVIGALGGVVAPALIYLALVGSGPATSGWGVPIATDIAFAVGVLALLGARASGGAKLLLLAVAIVDDLLAIAVIAIFYTDHIEWGWLAFAAGVLVAMAALRGTFVSPWAYAVPALALWVAVLESGVHATIAGVALGLLTPARPVHGRPVMARLVHRWHPISAYLVVPVFALANAGVDLRGGALETALTQRLTWAVAIAMVLGKLIGIGGGVFAARGLGVGVLPAGMPARQVWPVAALGGIGFTVALFITDLAFKDQSMIDYAKVGIFVGSFAAALVGAVLLRLAGSGTAAAKSPREDPLPPR